MSQQTQVIAIIAEVLQCPVDEIQPERRFVQDLGVSSLQLVDVVWRLEEELELPETPPSQFAKVITVQDMIDMIDKAVEESAGKERPKRSASSRIFDVALASDHAGVTLKAYLAELLRKKQFLVADLGPQSSLSVDYPEYASKVTDMIAEEKARFGILICGSGVGMSMAANRHPKIRAALVTEPVSAGLSRQHNNANVLCLGARLIGRHMAEACVETFLNTAFEPGDDQRHLRRIRQFSE